MNKSIVICNLKDDKLTEVVEKYLNQIHKEYLNKSISFHQAVISNAVIAESYEFIGDKANVDEIIYSNMKIIRNGIEENILDGNLALFGGLSEAALSIYTVYNKTNYYKTFLDQVNDLLVNELIGTMEGIKKHLEDLMESDYDVISGLSGIASYLLLIDGYENSVKEIFKILISICGNKKINGKDMPKWHIKSSNLDEETRANYPEGYLNLGLAHGIAGPLSILSKGYKKGIIVEGQKEAILSIIKEYKTFAYLLDGSYYWDKQLGVKDYWEQFKKCDKAREGWCYGNIALARILSIACEAIENKAIKEWADEIIEEKAKRGINEYNLISPTLCHGYAGVMSIFSQIEIRGRSPSIINIIDTIREKIYTMFESTSKYGFFDIEIRSLNGCYIITKEDENKFLIGAGGVVLALLESYEKGIFLNTHLLI